MRAREAGAEITSDPEDQAYGERSFSATDFEGHVWTFAQQLRDVPAEEWGAVIPDDVAMTDVALTTAHHAVHDHRAHS